MGTCRLQGTEHARHSSAGQYRICRMCDQCAADRRCGAQRVRRGTGGSIFDPQICLFSRSVGEMIQPVVPAVPAADIHMAVYRRSCSAECEARGVPTPRRLDER